MKSLRQRAQDIGVSPAYLSRVLSGRQKVSSRVLKLLTKSNQVLTETHEIVAGRGGAPNGIRIHVAGLKGQCPRPLDDGGVMSSIAESRLADNALAGLAKTVPACPARTRIVK